MGPKGERGHPGSIVWNGIKVNKKCFFFLNCNKYEELLIDIG